MKTIFLNRSIVAKMNTTQRYLSLLSSFFAVLFVLGSCIETYIENPDGDDDDDDDSTTIINSDDFSLSSVEALKDNYTTHENPSDYVWENASVVAIALNGKTISAEGKGATVSGNVVTITSAGNYSFSGSLTDGQVVVNTEDTSAVRIILNNAEIAFSSGSTIKIEKASKTILVAEEGTTNKIVESSATDSTTAAINCSGDMTLCGTGKLTVESTNNDAIVSNDGIIITSLTLGVTSGDDAIRGEDYLVVKSGTLTLEAGGDGLKSDNDEDGTKGYFALISGSVEITSSGDALSATTDAIIVDGKLTATSGTSASSGSAKGIKGLVNVIVEKGTIDLTSADNAIHSKGNIAINGGTIHIKTPADGADGINSDSLVTITGGNIEIEIEGNQSKGIKSEGKMALNGGYITIKSTGDIVLEASGSGYTLSYCTALKSNSDLSIDGSTISIISSGIGGKGVSTDGNLSMTSGSLSISATGNGATYKNTGGTTDAYNATCITSDGETHLIGGTIVLSNSGSAGKGISSTGALTIGNESNVPTITITTTGSKILVSGSASTGNGGFGGGPGGNPGGSTADYSSAKAIKSDAAIIINNGTITISSADDGIKSEKSITINNGSVTVSTSTEGMESPAITINNGFVSVTSSDDGFNATAGLTAGGTEQNDGSSLVINGGTATVNTTSGDGIDSNGNFKMTAGTVVVQGPQAQPELGLDVNGTVSADGGFLILSGPNSGNMIEAPGTTSSQYSLKITSSSIGTNLVHVEDASGSELFTFKPARSAYYLVFSSPSLKNGASYSIYTGGNTTGTSTNGCYSGGTYSGGTLKKTFSVSGKVTSVSF